MKKQNPWGDPWTDYHYGPGVTVWVGCIVVLSVSLVVLIAVALLQKL